MEVELRWTVGLSGHTPEAVKEIYALLSLDNFHVPSILKPSTVVPGEFVAYRMLPPVQDPIEVVYFFDDFFTIAQDFALATPSKRLLLSRTMNMGRPDSPAIVEVEREPAPDCECEAAIKTPRTGAHRHWDCPLHGPMAEVFLCNLLSPTERAKARFGRDGGCALTVAEDPAQRERLCIQPREHVGGPAVRQSVQRTTEWAPERSVWGPWARNDTDPQYWAAVVQHDWAAAKKKLAHSHSPMELQGMLEAVTERYPKLVRLYDAFAGLGASNAGNFRLPLNRFLELFTKAGVTQDVLSRRELEIIFLQCTAVNKINAMDPGPGFGQVKPGVGLRRCQFLEAVMRISDAIAKKTNARAPNCVLGAVQLMEITAQAADTVDDFAKQTLRSLFTQELDMVFRKHMNTLRLLFDHYAGLSRGFPTPTMLLREFMSMLGDLEAYDTEFKLRHGSSAFSYGLVLRVDDALGRMGAEMKFTEFLVALGFVIRYRKGWSKELYAELIEDFFASKVADLVHDLQTANPWALSRRKVEDKADQRMEAWIRNFFTRVDDDGSNTLDTREFRQMCGSDEGRKKFATFGVDAHHIQALFSEMDVDGDGVLSADEVVLGVQNAIRAELVNEKAAAFLRFAFAEADVDNSGDVTLDELRAKFTEKECQEKLLRLGMDVQDIDQFFIELDVDNSGTISLDELLVGFSRFRDPGISGDPALDLALEEVFFPESQMVSKSEAFKLLQQPAGIKMLRMFDFGKSEDFNEVLNDLFEMYEIASQERLGKKPFLIGFYHAKRAVDLRRIVARRKRKTGKNGSPLHSAARASMIAKEKIAEQIPFTPDASTTISGDSRSPHDSFEAG